MRYVVLKIKELPVELTFTASELANRLPTDGVWELDDEWHIYFRESVYSQEKSKIIRIVKEYFGDSVHLSEEIFNDDGVDWNEEWKKNYKPVYITENIVIYPSWFDILPEDSQKIIIKIDPQMGFGTGTHETTQLMIQMIDKYLKSPGKVLDMGTGSGILAILCEKLYDKADVTGIEIDEDALENAKLNGKINNCTRINWILGGKEKIPEDTFDLILANINRSVLLTMIPDFAEHLSRNGKMILSGILAEEKDLIIESCTKNQMELVEEKQKNEWIVQVWQLRQ